MMGVVATWSMRSRFGHGTRSTLRGATRASLRWGSWTTSWRPLRTPEWRKGYTSAAGTVAIQVLQHGSRREVHHLLGESLQRVAPGGLFAVRVNAVGTDVQHAHEVIERDPDGSYSVRYLEGPKA